MPKDWHARQQKDPYVRKAREEGLRSRAAFKLTQINERYKILKPGDAVVDLGAAPGGWLVVTSKIIGAQGKLVGVDLKEIAPIPGVELLQADIFAPETLVAVRALLNGQADVVLSDAAPQTSGIRITDHARSIAVGEGAARIAAELLKPGGNFVAKIYEGEDLGRFMDSLRPVYRNVRAHSPPASRDESKEIYVIAQGFIPAGSAAKPRLRLKLRPAAGESEPESNAPDSTQPDTKPG